MNDLFEKINNALRSPSKGIIAGVWTEEKTLIAAAKKVKAEGYNTLEAVSPYPLHDIDEILDIPRSFIPWVTFCFALLGCSFGVWLTWWTHSESWALNIGGKPYFAFPAYIPIIFECTILFAAHSSVIAMILTNGLPKVDPPIIDPDLTSHKFALFIREDDEKYDREKIEKLFTDLGAETVKQAEF